MEFLTLEVDGSLSNPFAAGAVAIWTVCLSVFAVVLARRSWAGGSWPKVSTVLFIIGLLATNPAQVLIGNVLYSIADRQIVSVGFWGGPPIWIAPAVSCALGVLTWTRVRRRPLSA